MKGLLTKDLCLLKGRKRTFFMIVAVLLIFGLFTDNFIFSMMYLEVLIVTIATSTISYDEFDNGYAFLFTLPVTRKRYVEEKYLFSMGMMAAACIVGLGFGGVMLLLTRGEAGDAGQLLTVGLICLMIGFGMNMVALPVYLKYGAEKGGVAIMVIYIAIAAMILAPVLLVKKLGLGMPVWVMKLGAFLDGNYVPHKGTAVLAAAAALALTAGFLWISFTVSCRIMERKEF